MTRIRVSVDLAAPVSEVWNELADLESHTRWMADAEEIEFLTEQRRGKGTRMKVLTVVGPFRTRDLMTVTDWVEEAAIGVKHEGLVTGTGRFLLSAIPGGTRITWEELLVFPLWLGGPVAAALAKPILARIWRRNLGTLRQVVLSAP